MMINMYKKSFTDFVSKRWLMSQTPPLTEQRRPLCRPLQRMIHRIIHWLRHWTTVTLTKQNYVR